MNHFAVHLSGKSTIFQLKKIMVIKRLTKCGRRIEEHSENFNKEIENIKIY